MSIFDTKSTTWHPNFVKIIGIFALVLPIFGALLYHLDYFSYIGKLRYIISLRTLIMVIASLSMILMPHIFVRILDNKSNLDEHEIFQRARALNWSYRLLAIICLTLLGIAIFEASKGLSGKEMQHLLTTFFNMILVYAIVIPFNFLAWTLDPLDDE